MKKIIGIIPPKVDVKEGSTIATHSKKILKIFEEFKFNSKETIIVSGNLFYHQCNAKQIAAELGIREECINYSELMMTFSNNYHSFTKRGYSYIKERMRKSEATSAIIITLGMDLIPLMRHVAEEWLGDSKFFNARKEFSAGSMIILDKENEKLQYIKN